MKLFCGECRRVMEARKKDIEALHVCIDGCRPILVRREHEGAEHLVCPFCTIEGNGVFWLQRLKKPVLKPGAAT
jgi:DNA-directed RNA polymerase subunit M/transcription elongation factor TFIIS